MKKYFAAAVIGAMVGIGIYKATKRKQNKAEEVGRHVPYGAYEAYFKRPLDYMAALLALLFLCPVLGIVALTVRIKLGSPVIFTQERPGKDGKIFRLYKFRTMTDARDKDGELLSDEVRLTEFGKKLRATSLDELPELFNILKGEMSLVGPRPQLVRDMVFMTDRQRERHTARPGLSGLAQVNGRNAIGWADKLAWDLKYIEKVSFAGDVKIMLQTILKAFVRREGITDGDTVTALDYGDWLLKTGEISQEEYDAKQKEAEKILGAVK